MSKEWSEGYQMLPEGEYIFSVQSISESVGEGTKRYREWVLTTLDGENPEKLTMRFYSWQVAPLIAVLGFKQIKNEQGRVGYEWNTSDAIGKSFKAKIRHKERNGKTFYDIGDFQQVADTDIPF